MSNYIYKYGVLKNIALHYLEIDEDGLSFREGSSPIFNQQSISEFRCDFEMALSSLGYKFRGIKGEFKDYHSWPDIQRIILVDIFNLTWYELRRIKQDYLLSLRKEAYNQMCDYLNGVKIKS